MTETGQFKILYQILGRFQEAGILKDIEMAVGLLEFLYTKPNEVKRIKSILSAIPKTWRHAILSVSEKHFPQLNEVTL